MVTLTNGLTGRLAEIILLNVTPRHCSSIPNFPPEIFLLPCVKVCYTPCSDNIYTDLFRHLTIPGPLGLGSLSSKIKLTFVATIVNQCISISRSPLQLGWAFQLPLPTLSRRVIPQLLARSQSAWTPSTPVVRHMEGFSQRAQASPLLPSLTLGVRLLQLLRTRRLVRQLCALTLSTTVAKSMVAAFQRYVSVSVCSTTQSSVPQPHTPIRLFQLHTTSRCAHGVLLLALLRNSGTLRYCMTHTNREI